MVIVIGGGGGGGAGGGPPPHYIHPCPTDGPTPCLPFLGALIRPINLRSTGGAFGWRWGFLKESGEPFGGGGVLSLGRITFGAVLLAGSVVFSSAHSQSQRTYPKMVRSRSTPASVCVRREGGFEEKRAGCSMQRPTHSVEAPPPSPPIPPPHLLWNPRLTLFRFLARNGLVLTGCTQPRSTLLHA